MKPASKRHYFFCKLGEIQPSKNKESGFEVQELQLIDFSQDITLYKSSGKYVFLARCCVSLSACQSVSMQTYVTSFSPCFLLHSFSSVLTSLSKSADNVPYKVCNVQANTLHKALSNFHLFYIFC